jgi:hypothetical protein
MATASSPGRRSKKRFDAWMLAGVGVYLHGFVPAAAFLPPPDGFFRLLQTLIRAAGHAHGLHSAVVAGLGPAIARVGLDQPVVQPFGGAPAGLGVLPEMDRAVEGLRMLQAPGGNFVGIDPDLAVVDPGLP